MSLMLRGVKSCCHQTQLTFRDGETTLSFRDKSRQCVSLEPQVIYIQELKGAKYYFHSILTVLR